MTVWLREIAGWILLGCGLATFVVTYVLLLQRLVIEGVGFGMIGFVIFRGGMHLLKVAIAARAAREVPRLPEPGRTPRAIQLPGAGAAPGRPRPAVVPGATR